jgi:hypothetical protein
MEEEVEVVVHLGFAFDIGYEIDLPAVRSLLQAETGPITRRRRTPESIRYRPAPVRLPIDLKRFDLPGDVTVDGPIRADLGLFDFGAVSLTIALPLRITAAALLDLAAGLADVPPLQSQAKAAVEPVVERIRSAVIEFEWSDLTEEYIVFQLGEVAPDWLEAHADWAARLVRLDADPLSGREIREATRLHLSYSVNDLVILDWAAGLIADRDCADTLQIIEFANVQLLEFRHIDDRLDDRLEAAYRLIHPGPGRLMRWRSHDDAMRSVRELEIEATSLFERADNALKLIGDQYLSRVFGLASTRFHLVEWQQSIRRKLDTVGDVYDLLVQQSGGRRMETLELIVVILIAMEIVLALLRH